MLLRKSLKLFKLKFCRASPVLQRSVEHDCELTETPLPPTLEAVVISDWVHPLFIDTEEPNSPSKHLQQFQLAIGLFQFHRFQIISTPFTMKSTIHWNRNLKTKEKNKIKRKTNLTSLLILSAMSNTVGWIYRLLSRLLAGSSRKGGRLDLHRNSTEELSIEILILVTSIKVHSTWWQSQSFSNQFLWQLLNRLFDWIRIGWNPNHTKFLCFKFLAISSSISWIGWYAIPMYIFDV